MRHVALHIGSQEKDAYALSRRREFALLFVPGDDGIVRLAVRERCDRAIRGFSRAEAIARERRLPREAQLRDDVGEITVLNPKRVSGTWFDPATRRVLWSRNDRHSPPPTYEVRRRRSDVWASELATKAIPGFTSAVCVGGGALVHCASGRRGGALGGRG
jgi:hypothetical protein